MEESRAKRCKRPISGNTVQHLPFLFNYVNQPFQLFVFTCLSWVFCTCIQSQLIHELKPLLLWMWNLRSNEVKRGAQNHTGSMCPRPPSVCHQPAPNSSQAVDLIRDHCSLAGRDTRCSEANTHGPPGSSCAWRSFAGEHGLLGPAQGSSNAVSTRVKRRFCYPITSPSGCGLRTSATERTVSPCGSKTHGLGARRCGFRSWLFRSLMQI